LTGRKIAYDKMVVARLYPSKFDFSRGDRKQFSKFQNLHPELHPKPDAIHIINNSRDVTSVGEYTKKLLFSFE